MPRPDCVSCRSNAKRGKLLMCLHSLCVECLEKHISDDSSVLCSKCGEITPAKIGLTVLQALPDSDVAAAGADDDQQQQLRKCCDECAEDTVAVAICSDCNDTLCALHAQSHPASRRSYQHKVAFLSDQAVPGMSSSNKPAIAAKCPFHPSSPQSHYCLTCNTLLCDKCLATRRHENHCRQVQPIQQAAAEIRKSLASKMDAGFMGREGDLDVALAKAEAALSGLADETDSVSAEVTGFFEGLKRAVDKREQELLDQLSMLRSAHLLPLERQKRRLLSGLSSGQKVKHLTETCCDDVNFLKMAAWLEEAASDAISAGGAEVKPFSPCTFVFTPCCHDELNAAIDCAGAVDDIDMLSSAKSTMACPASVPLGDELLVSIEARSLTGETLGVKQAHLEALKVDIVADDHTHSECTITTTSTTGTAVAKYKPTKRGPVTVSAKTRFDRHLRGSPTTVNITDPLQFDPTQCHSDIRLSNGNKTATRVGRMYGGFFRAVGGTVQWTVGKHEIAIRIDKFTALTCTHLLYVSAAGHFLDSFACSTGITFGWEGSTTSASEYFGGSALGQPWQRGDIITLTMDCDEHTLVGRHERTGATETLTDVTGRQLQLYVCLYHAQDQVTIL